MDPYSSPYINHYGSIHVLFDSLISRQPNIRYELLGTPIILFSPLYIPGVIRGLWGSPGHLFEEPRCFSTYVFEVNEDPIVCEIPKCLLARCPMARCPIGRCTKARYGWNCCTRQQPDLPVFEFFIKANSDVHGSLANFSKNCERPAVAWFFLSVGRPVWRLQYKFPGSSRPR